MLLILLLGGILATGSFSSSTPEPTSDVNLPKEVPPPVNEEDFNQRMGIHPKDPRMAKSLFKVHGGQGKNYFVQEGRPYINCGRSNFERPADMDVKTGFYGNATPDDAKRQEQCFLELDRRHYRLSCMAVFVFKGKAEDLLTHPSPRSMFVLQNQGCWSNQPEAIEGDCVPGPTCVYKGAVIPNEQHFCCCDEHNCNEYVDYDPTREFRPDRLEIAKDQQAHRVRLNISIASVKPIVKEERPSIEKYYIWIMIATIFLLIALIIVASVICYRRRKKLQKETTQMEALISQEASAAAPAKRNWEVVYPLEEVGQGKYGKVYKGECTLKSHLKPILVAVKVFKGNSDSFNNELAIYSEPAIQNCLKPSILRLIQSEESSLTILTEYCSEGNLHTYLKQKIIPSPQCCLSIIQNLCEGLAFLHEERGPSQAEPKPTILHRDIKSHNILLKPDSRGFLIGVIMDFGLSLRVNQTPSKEAHKEMSKIVGTQRYMAPELLIGAAEIDVEHFKAIDVYAMALVFWEIISRTKLIDQNDEEIPPYSEPYEKELREEQKTAGVLRLSTYRQVVHGKKIRPTFREDLFRDNVFQKLASSVEEMWDHEAGSRVRIACVKTRVDHLIRDEGYGSWDGKPPSPPSSTKNASTLSLNSSKTASLVASMTMDETEQGSSSHPSTISLVSKEGIHQEEEEDDRNENDLPATVADWHPNESATALLLLNGKRKKNGIISRKEEFELSVIK